MITTCKELESLLTQQNRISKALEVKEARLKGCIPYDSISTTFSERQNCTDREQSSQGLGLGLGVLHRDSTR